MEITDWLILIAILVLIFWAKFYHPVQYQAVMGVVDGLAKSAMSLVDSFIQTMKSPPADNSTEPITNGGGG